jgi:glycosyltransferase involved in cell wall biosynthesis
MTAILSVVMPVYNEAEHLPATIDALVEAVELSGFAAELIVVDDGSTDRSAEVARRALAERLPLVVVAQSNSGRFAARRAGLEAATGEWVLLLDGRVRLAPTALTFVRGQLGDAARVWNGHVHIDAQDNPYGAFWNVLTEIAWREYFDNPRTTSFDTERFDHYPKGTTCFLSPRTLLLDAVAVFRSYYPNERFVSDDTALIRWLAERERIHLSPDFACHYAPRANLRAFLGQAVYRGSTFVDGHGRRKSRFFLVVVAFFPVCALLAVAAIRRPVVVPAVAAASALAAGVVAAVARRSRFEMLSFSWLMPLYAVGHGLGMWRGLLLIIRRVSDRTATRASSPPESHAPGTARH